MICKKAILRLTFEEGILVDALWSVETLLDLGNQDIGLPHHPGDQEDDEHGLIVPSTGVEGVAHVRAQITHMSVGLQ